MFNWLKKLFTTKRILEEGGFFYPQKWRLLWFWKDKDDGYLWLTEEYGKKYSRCSSLEEATKILNKKFNTIEYHYV